MKSSGTKYAKDRRTRSGNEPVPSNGFSGGSDTSVGKAAQERYDEMFTSPQTQRVEGVLTSKELQLLELLSYGYENGDIADHFRTSLQAVKNMLRTINLKLGADNRTHAVSICFRNDWLPLRGDADTPADAGLPERGNGRRGTSR